MRLNALRNRNFRIYLAGQSVSQVGAWFQTTAEIWLILQITGSATAVGIQSALKFGPLLLFGMAGGLITDRFDRRTVLFLTQSGYTIAVGTLAIAAFLGTPDLLLIYAVVFARGMLNAIDNPLRRAFVRDLVTDDVLTNAVSLNSTMHTLARFVGPALAGVTIVTLGVSWCFAIKAVSYGAVLVSLFFIDRAAMRPSHRAEAGAAQILEGLRYAWDNRRIRRTLFIVTTLGAFAWNYDVILPLYATEEFGGNATLYGMFVSVIGVGAFGGAMTTMRLTTITGSHLRAACLVLGAALIGLAATPFLATAVLGLALVGGAMTSFQILAQSRLQLEAEDHISGRVLALYSIALMGVRPVGAPVLGWVVDTLGSRTAFGLCSAVVLALVVVLLLTRPSRGPEPAGAVQVTDAEEVAEPT